MANAITKFKKYIDLLDEVYKQASCTAVLDGDNTLVKAGANANEIVIPKISMDGLADYNRNSGYVKGDVTESMLPFHEDSKTPCIAPGAGIFIPPVYKNTSPLSFCTMQSPISIESIV